MLGKEAQPGSMRYAVDEDDENKERQVIIQPAKSNEKRKGAMWKIESTKTEAEQQSSEEEGEER